MAKGKEKDTKETKKQKAIAEALKALYGLTDERIKLVLEGEQMNFKDNPNINEIYEFICDPRNDSNKISITKLIFEKIIKETSDNILKIEASADLFILLCELNVEIPKRLFDEIKDKINIYSIKTKEVYEHTEGKLAGNLTNDVAKLYFTYLIWELRTTITNEDFKKAFEKAIIFTCWNLLGSEDERIVDSTQDFITKLGGEVLGRNFLFIETKMKEEIKTEKNQRQSYRFLLDGLCLMSKIIHLIEKDEDLNDLDTNPFLNYEFVFEVCLNLQDSDEEDIRNSGREMMIEEIFNLYEDTPGTNNETFRTLLAVSIRALGKAVRVENYRKMLFSIWMMLVVEENSKGSVVLSDGNYQHILNGCILIQKSQEKDEREEAVEKAMRIDVTIFKNNAYEIRKMKETSGNTSIVALCAGLLGKIEKESPIFFKKLYTNEELEIIEVLGTNPTA